MYCPLCESEYKPGIRICGDCNVTLVEALPVEKPLKEIKWVPTGILPGKIYAEMIGEILDEQNIAHFIKSDILTTTFNITGLGSTGGRVTLFVPEENLETARNIIADIIDR